MTATSIPSKIRNAVMAIIVIFLLLSASMYLKTWFNFPLEMYRTWFGLKADSTVADYRAASDWAKVYWLDKMCDNGVCLHQIDWRCGFSISTEHPVEHDLDVENFDAGVRLCFTSIVTKAPLAEALGKLRLICGRRYMVFAGELYSTPRECAEAGGQWGKKLSVFTDEDSYTE
jgi:hypothetical protein